jgi:hypothetical protein
MPPRRRAPTEPRKVAGAKPDQPLNDPVVPPAAMPPAAVLGAAAHAAAVDPTAPAERKRNPDAIAAGLPTDVPDGYVRVFARSNVLGLAANHWGDVPVDMHHLEECLRRRLVLLEDEAGNPAPASLPPRACCGNNTPGQH